MKKQKNVVCALTAIGLLLPSPLLAYAAEPDQKSTDWPAEIAALPKIEPTLLKPVIPNPVELAEAAPKILSVSSDLPESQEPGGSSPSSSEPALLESKSPSSGPFKAPALASGDGLLAERIGFDEAPSGSFNQIDMLSKQVILKEIELLKLNTRYRIESTRIGKWKPWRQFVYSLAANTLIEVGISHIAYARWKYWRRPTLATKAFLRKGPECLLIGHAIIVGGVLIETGFDMLAQYQQNKKGFDRKTCRNKALALKGEIEKLIQERDVSVQATPMSSGQTEVLKVEGKVLNDVKECAVGEFSRLAVRERKIKTARDVANVMTFTQAATGGFVGSLGNLLAVVNRKPRLAVPAGVGFTTSGAFIVLTPPVAKILSIVAANREKKAEAAFFGVNPKSMSDLDADRSALGNALANAGGGLESARTRLDIYTKQKEIMDKQLLAAKAEAQLNRREFIEKCVSNGIAGGTKISWGINLIVAGSDFSNTARKAAPTLPVRLGNKVYRVPIRTTKTPAQMFSRRVAQGATSNIPGPFVGALDAVQSRFRGETRAHKAKKNGTAPGQLLAARMKILEDMEAKLK